MLMFVARKFETGIDIIGCRGGGGGYLVVDIACPEPSSGYLEDGVDVAIKVPEVIDEDGGLVDLT